MHDKKPPTAERLAKIERSEPSDADFYVECRLVGVDHVVHFRISWSYLYSCYSAEYVSPDGVPLWVDVFGWAAVHDFFQQNWGIPKVIGVRCDEHHDDNQPSIIERLFTPTPVAEKPTQ